MTGFDLYEDVSNPLDSIEEVMAGHDWTFQRPTDDELTVHISGTFGQYTMTFIWHEPHSAMQFFCEFDLSIPTSRFDMTSKVLRGINENLWLGHFDVPEDSNAPYFRHTTLLRGMTQTSGTDHIADLIEVALAECEKYYSVFHLLAESSSLNDDVLTLALAENEGQA
ncbi:MAG: YbjN domain-containing protein [Rhodospirillales bacterium]|nr:YbjN domain-containing protein [Rhodospirillales bacterium]MCB9995435.1 YbjN domain-containing protein [Rhodospirillales bacterium]